jgi:hypothetical protein
LLAEHLSFESMKNNPAVNKEDVVKTLQRFIIHGREKDFKFIRKGQVDSWKEEFPVNLKELFDNWIERHSISGLYP